MNLFEGFFWTPGWTSAATLLLAPLIGLGGVALSLANQRWKFKSEMNEKRIDSLREALADLLALHSEWYVAGQRVLQFDTLEVLESRDPKESSDEFKELEMELFRVTGRLGVSCIRVELLTRDRNLLHPIGTLNRHAIRFNNDPERNWTSWQFGHSAFLRLAAHAKQSIPVHGLNRPLVSDSDPWRVRRREYKRARRTGEEATYAPPLWKQLWQKFRTPAE